MIYFLTRYNSPLLIVLFHVGIGVVSAITPFPLITYFYLVLVTSVGAIFSRRKVDNPLSFLIVYMVSFELIARMAGTSPFIPYELGKYLLFFLLTVGIANGRNKGTVGTLLVLLLIPALFYDRSNQVGVSDIVFNVLGAVNIGLAIWFFKGQVFTHKGLNKLLIVAVLPLIASLAYTIFESPDLSSFDFNLAGNYALAGNFGPNQVATALGFGFFVTFYIWLMQMRLTGRRWLDLAIALLFFFQGLLSFSRGGIIGGAIGVLIVLYYLYLKPNKSYFNFIIFRKVKRYVIPGALVLALSLFMANAITGNKLFLRYQGESLGTIAGTKDVTINTLTTHRWGILLADIELFVTSGFTGVGAGASRYVRSDYNGVLAHVEASRLLAEHGLFGLVYILIAFYLIIQVWRKNTLPIYKGLLLSFIIIGWYTTFHAATRTYISPLLIGLSLIVIHEPNPLPRK